MARQETRTAWEIGEQVKLGDDARHLLDRRQKPVEYLSLLIDKGLYQDGIRYTAYYLPKRQAILWGCLCAWHYYRPTPPAKESKALESAVRWVKIPTEENRRDAHVAGLAAGLDTPAGGLALAVYFTEGSISEPGLPEVAPGPFITAKTVAGAVLLAANLAPAPKVKEYRRQFLALAEDVAFGRIQWFS